MRPKPLTWPDTCVYSQGTSWGTHLTLASESQISHLLQMSTWQCQLSLATLWGDTHFCFIEPVIIMLWYLLISSVSSWYCAFPYGWQMDAWALLLHYQKDKTRSRAGSSLGRALDRTSYCFLWISLELHSYTFLRWKRNKSCCTLQGWVCTVGAVNNNEGRSFWSLMRAVYLYTGV